MILYCILSLLVHFHISYIIILPQCIHKCVLPSKVLKIQYSHSTHKWIYLSPTQNWSHKQFTCICHQSNKHTQNNSVTGIAFSIPLYKKGLQIYGQFEWIFSVSFPLCQIGRDIGNLNGPFQQDHHKAMQ